MRDKKDEALKATFRQRELSERSARRKRLLQELDGLMRRMANEKMNLEEALSPEEMAAHSAAIYAIQRGEALWIKTLETSYWRRLWRALFNR